MQPNDRYYSDLVYGNEYTISQIFFTLFSVGFFSLICPSWVVARFCMKKNELLQEEDLFVPYEKRYPINSLDCSGNKQGLDRNVLLESTPQGKICMKYCDEEEAFVYWSDNSIDYKYLEAVARKYVITFHCSEIYIDREKALKEKLDKAKAEIEENKKILEEEKNGEKKEKEEEEEEEEEEESVFIVSKKAKEEKKLKLKLTPDDRTIEKCNKYVRRGKFVDATWFRVEKPKDKKMEMSFKDWLLGTKNKNV